ncbi:golgin subfamily B member 1-like isoform X2 [Mercenaria mercenaria]|uniref:golgin subfamily B member 1-like isoform X2 n=1 Tax=Mercenaria mercenaria TaxID=6596 RepID=UPI00234E4C26|nr:golgin subfamily B member 1-like isoform X2 [Mercenaria mercenaria]
MQMPVFLTEPPQMHTSPSPRKQKKHTKRTRQNGYISGENLALDLISEPVTVRSSRQEKHHGKQLETSRSSGDDTARQPALLADVRAGLQRAYLEGIEFMRLKIKETEEELTQIKLGFYQCEEADDENYEKYLVQCNEQFLQANNDLRRKNVKLKVVDSEMELVSLLNQLRDKMEIDKGEIAFLSEFWENLKSTMESVKVLVNKFKTSVVDRLRGNCISYNNGDIHLDVSARYTEEVKNYLNELEQQLDNTLKLIQSFANGIHQDLFSHTKFTEGILVACDLKAFPILRLFPDLTEKVESMCSTAFVWLDRDERYMYEIKDYIRETRTMAKKRVEDLKVQKEKMKKFEKAVKSANIMLHNNKEKLQKLESDLNQLEQTFNVYKQQMDSKCGEKSQKESMVDFLKITLSQTKKNYNLQLKRQRLLKQVESLEDFLKSLERDLSSVQTKIQEKAQQKDILAVKLETNEKSYGALKTDLESFTENLDSLEQEVNGLSGQLLQLEIIQTFKSSPENLDGVFDRPQSVKLAPSLKEKIKRKRKILPPVH